MNRIVLTVLPAALIAAAPAQSQKPADAAAGKKIFEAKCATCHGKSGTGSPAMAKMFKTSPELLDLTSPAVAKLSDEDVQKIISGGRNKMPSFKSKLKPGQIAYVVAYLRTLAKPGK